MSGWKPKWGHLQDVGNNDGRRNSISKMFQRIRSGSLPGWIDRNIGTDVSSGGLGSPSCSTKTENCSSLPQEKDFLRSETPSSYTHSQQTNIKDTEMTLIKPQSTITPVPHSFLPHASPIVSSDNPSSSNSSSNTSTWTTSAGGHSSVSTEQDEISSSSNSPNESRDYHGELLLRTVKVALIEDDPSSLYPLSPLCIESSPLTPRKKFTIVPCAQDDHSLDHLEGHLDPIKDSKRRGNQNLAILVSALYGKLLIVLGIAFPMAEVISTYIPPSFYDGFYLYLYFGSITFMICIYGNMLRQKATRSMRGTLQRINGMKSRFAAVHMHGEIPKNIPTSPQEISSDSEECASGSHHNDHDHYLDYTKQRIHFGSFYLRMGAVAFGIGSMIYSGLEFGQYFELQPDTKCHNFMIALTPAVRMIFTFMQMYFIFLNSKMAVYKLELGAQFGLMHMIGTNLCVWLNVLVQETRHEILMFYNPDNGTIIYPSGPNPNIYQSNGASYFMSQHNHGYNHGYSPILSTISTTIASIVTSALTTSTPSTTTTMMTPTTTTPHFSTPSIISSHLASELVKNDFVSVGSDVVNTTMTTLISAIEPHIRVRRGLKGPYSFLECRRSDIMGSLVQNASPFLFPCTIEYSLICAAILYVMWKSMTKMNNRKFHRGHFHNGDILHNGAKRSPHHYSVDCARANKGLFLGIFVLVMTIISLILFFVLITRPGYQAMAVLEVNITELVLYTMTTVAVLIGMCQMRELRYVRSRNLELDSTLLIVAQTGSFIYNVFTIIGGHFTMKNNTVLVLVTAMSSLIQLLVQTLFILDASKRSASTSEQARRKPGREVVTFLLVTNLAMWAINTLEKSRADSHPVQLKFYGVWAWTFISHISMPLAIFYRFHSTVCLCEIWKRAYKVKPPVYR